jgi:hypothetical protein
VDKLTIAEGTTPHPLSRPSRRALRQLVLACTALGTLALPVLAETPPGLQKFAGNYKYSKDRDHGVAIVEKALDAALGDLNMVMKLLVKKTMSGRFAETVLIELSGGELGIKIGENEKATVGVGKTETVKSADGNPSGKVTHQFDGTKITETLTGDNGSITNVFQLSADGKTLQRDVNVVSPRLQKPLKYRLIYTRK